MTRPARRRPGRPLVIAHRGASAESPEHTLIAYERAIDAGADGLECDVRLTADGHLVCLHDRTIDRVSNGAGPVSRLTLPQLRRLDFGSWHDGEPATVLPLIELLDLVHDVGRPIRLLIETKHPSRFGGQVERELMTLLERFGWTGAADRPTPVTVMSFAERALRRVHRRAPELPTVLLLEKAAGVRRLGLLPEPIAIAGPSVDLVRADPTYVERARTLGSEVYVWTVDDQADLDLVATLGVDAVITNRPAEVISGLAAR